MRTQILYPIFLLKIVVMSSCVSTSMLPTQNLLIANEYFNQQQYEKAIEHYHAYINYNKGQGKYRNFVYEADANRKVAHAYSVLGKYNQTILHLNNAMRLDSAENNRIAYAEDVRLLGMAYAYSNEYNKAISYLTKATTLTESFGRSIKEDKLQTLANTYLSLSHIHATLGDFSIGETHANKALALYNKIKDENGQAQALQQVAWLQIEKGFYRNAEEKLEKSITIYNNLNLFAFEQYVSLGDIATKENRYEDALRNYLEALSKADSSKILPQIVWSNIKVGDAYSSLGMVEKAMDYYQKSLKLNAEMDKSNLTPALNDRTGNVIEANRSYLKNNIKYGSALSYLKIGELYNSTKPDSSVYFYNQAISIFNRFSNKDYVNRAIVLKSEFEIEQGNHRMALENLLPIIESSQDQELLWQSYFLTGCAYEKLNRESLAISNYIKSIEIIEELRGSIVIDEFRDSYFSNKIKVYDNLIFLLQKNSKIEEAWSYSEKARARSFLDIVEGKKLGKSNQADSSLIIKEQKLKAEISYLLKSITNSKLVTDSTRAATSVLSQKLKDKQQQYSDLLLQLDAFNSKYLQLISAKTPDLKEVREKIKDDYAIVQYWCSDRGNSVSIITNDTIITRMIDTDYPELFELVQNSRNQIPKSENHAQYYLGKLYKVLWQPVEEHLDSSMKICIVPHQCLHYIPFAALYNGEYLIERRHLQYAVSAALYDENSFSQTEDEFLGIALSKSNIGNYQPLIGTNQEVNLCRKYFENSTLVVDEKINETLVKNSMQDATIIHFATHGHYNNDEPLMSYLLLNSDSKNDGLLTVQEIFNCNIHSNLTTLSACQTGIGKISKGDDVISLNRAFLYAGASNVISTLWNINDKTTPKLMDKLYYYYNQNNSFEKALCLAQRDFIKNTSSNPYLWSAFVLYN